MLRCKIEAGQAQLAHQGGRDGREGDEKPAAEVGPQPVDESDHAGQRHRFLDVEVESVQSRQKRQIVQLRVTSLGSLRVAVQYPQDLDSPLLQRVHLVPQSVVLRVVTGVFIQRDAAAQVQIDGRDGDMRHVGA
ncbi:hypothetical protein MMC07_004099 [Pseudocyphellaria aurata]|nr:hypothetical protein [Pseudocyphellaria aurata]